MRRFLAGATDVEGSSKKLRTAVSGVANLCSQSVSSQCSHLAPPLLTAGDVEHALASITDRWVTHNGMMYKLRSGVHADSKKMVAFDMDGTLIATKSGKTYAVDEHDWKLWDESVRITLQRLHAEGVYIAIISNQNGIKIKKVQPDAVQRKVDKIIEAVGVPMDFICAIDDNHFRKPRTGMWEFLYYARRRHTKTNEDGAEAAVANSLYVGDAAGRPQEGTRGKDHSDSDYKLSLNMGIEFATPEKYFLGSTARLHCQLPDPRNASGGPFRLVDVRVTIQQLPDEYFIPPERRGASAATPTIGATKTLPPAAPVRPPVSPSDSPVRDDSGYEESLLAAAGASGATVAAADSSAAVSVAEAALPTAPPAPAEPAGPSAVPADFGRPEILLLAAPPACGKSTLSRRYEAAGYVRINQDTLGSVDKCIALARQTLNGERSVCVDNTNMDPATRQKWVQLAKQCDIQIRAVALKTVREVSSLLSAYRMLDPTTAPGDRRKIERIVVNTYFKNPVYPTTREGFASVDSLELQLVPPTNPQALRLFHMYLK